MDILRRASYLPQLRRIVIVYDAYTSSMTVRTRSRPGVMENTVHFNACVYTSGGCPKRREDAC